MTLYQDRGRAWVGFIVPISNSNLEPDMYRVCPTGVSVHFARAGGYDLDEIPNSEQMSKMADASLEPILKSLMAVRPDIVAYGCTSAMLTKDPVYDQKFTERMIMISGVPAITAAGCSVLCYQISIWSEFLLLPLTPNNEIRKAHSFLQKAVLMLLILPTAI